MEGDAPTTAITAMNALSDTVMPNLSRNITRNRETTLAPIPGPTLNLTTVSVSGETTVTVPTHLLPENPVLYAYPVLPAVPTHQITCLASLPLQHYDLKTSQRALIYLFRKAGGFSWTLLFSTT